jgi:hypothetical protein
MRLLIDIDGTVLTQQKPGEYEKARPTVMIVPDFDAEPISSVKFVNLLYDMGYQIVFYTNRNFKYMQMTYKQLRDFGFKFHHIDFGKPHADKIIDDRMVEFSLVDEEGDGKLREHEA